MPGYLHTHTFRLHLPTLPGFVHYQVHITSDGHVNGQEFDFRILVDLNKVWQLTLSELFYLHT